MRRAAESGSRRELSMKNWKRIKSRAHTRRIVGQYDRKRFHIGKFCINLHNCQPVKFLNYSMSLRRCICYSPFINNWDWRERERKKKALSYSWWACSHFGSISNSKIDFADESATEEWEKISEQKIVHCLRKSSSKKVNLSIIAGTLDGI